jgi:ABC-type transport system involved in multi-copper enzyme maturation permease subunit
MKFLAILKDSFREAIDTRVFPVMLALSALLLLVIGSISFTPEESTDELAMLLERTLWQRRGGPAGAEPANLLLGIKGVETADGSPPGPDRPFRVVVSARFATPEEAAQDRSSPGGVRELVRQRLGRLDGWQILQVTDCRVADAGSRFTPASFPPAVLYYEVTTRPTPATRYVWPYRSGLLFGAVPLDAVWQVVFESARPPNLGFQVWLIEDQLLGGPGAWVATIVSVIVTAFFIPNMLRKGSVELLLVKPIARWALLAYKYVGGLVFIFLNASVAIGGAWLVLGLRTGVWAPGILATVLVLTYFFAILYAVSAVVAVCTRSAVLAILLTCLVWFLLFVVGRAYTWRHDPRQPTSQAVGTMPADAGDLDKWYAVIDVVHYVLPRTDDLNPLTTELIAGSVMPPHQVGEFRLRPGTMNWGESLTVSAVFILVMLGLAGWRFATRDY